MQRSKVCCKRLFRSAAVAYINSKLNGKRHERTILSTIQPHIGEANA